MSYSAPVGGWNSRDALADMKPNQAVVLDNFFPKTSYCETRGGHLVSQTGMQGVGKTLAVYNSLTGTNKMFCATNIGVFDVSSTGALVDNYLSLPGTAGNYASSPDSAAADIVGDIDIRVRAALTDWTPPAITSLVSKSLATGNQRSYFFGVKTDGTLQFQNSPDGTAAALVTSASTIAPSIADGTALWVRVTVDINDGAGNNVVTFYTSADYVASTAAGTWTQLGAAVTNIGTTSIFNSTALVEIGSRDTGTTQLLGGKVYDAQIYNGIGLVKVVEFCALDTYAGDTAFPSFSTGEVWTLNGTAAIVGNGVSSRTNGKHQTTMFGDGTNIYLIMCNGVDKPLYYDGTVWQGVDATTSPALTGLTSTTLIVALEFKGRLIFIQKNSMSFWYLAAGAAGGALTQFDLDGVAKMGGYVMSAMTWTYDGGSGPDDRLVFITSEGEVIVYAGTNPSSSTTWALVGVFQLGKPLGRRCLIKYGGDVVAITQDGAFPLSTSLQSAIIDTRPALSDIISSTFTASARSYGANFGWETTFFPAQSALIFNIPVAEDGTHYQYVMNTITKAWCRFTGWNAETFCIFNGELYFVKGTSTYRAWSGTSDNGNNITFYGKTAFSYFGDMGAEKRFNMFRPVLAVNGNLSFLTDIDVDFNDTEVLGASFYSVTSSAQWNVSLWDSAYWAQGFEVLKEWTSPDEDMGRCASGKIKISSNAITVQWLSQDWVYEVGGVM